MPIVESLGLAALGWVASPVVKDLVAKSIAYLGSDIAKGLEDLETTLLPQFQLTIQAARNSPHQARLAQWLARLKNAYYDAEAILHELEYESLRRKVKGEHNKIRVRISSYPIIKPLAKFTSKISKKVSLLSARKRELWQRLSTLKKFAAEAKTFRELLAVNTSDGNHTPVGDTRPPTSAVLTNKVFGRDAVRNDIIKLLLEEQEASSSTSRHLVIAITGVGGAGKTTLAQYVYNDQRVEENFGARRMWLSLSQKKHIIERTKEMVECISGEKCPDLLNFSFLQKLLKEKLPDSEAVLLVLDDVWHDDTVAEEKQWEDLLAPFASLGERCKIVITSRSQRFPITLLPVMHIQLRDLADNDFLELFRYYAGLEISNSKMRNDLSDIVDQIAAKMNKSPLAAKVIGNQLRKQPHERFWQDTLTKVNLSDVMEILLWSYQRMDVQLQRCFLIFGTASRGVWFNRYNMVQWWVALDLIQTSDDNRSAEDVGLEFFDLMLANSMIAESINRLYVIHDLFYELARNLSAGYCFRVTDFETEIPLTTVLHVTLSVSNENLKEKLSSISNLRNLHSLCLETELIEDVNGTISMISKTFKNLRSLEIWSTGYSALPKTIGDLRNLRYLDVSRSSIKELPDSVSHLYHLQYLLLPKSLNSVPVSLKNLIKLRSIGKCDSNFDHVDTFPPVPHLGRLISLQFLPEFHVRKEEGYELHQLGCLSEIGGHLRIVGLENVGDKNEAVAARLIDKPKLTGVQLVWTGSAESIASEIDVIEALQPPTNLKFLTVDRYKGFVYPTWLQEGSNLPYLQSVGFYNCNALKVLPLNFSQFCHCIELVLENLGALSELRGFPENLDKLKIINCPCLILVHKNELQLQVDTFQDIVGNGFLPSVHYPWKEILGGDVKSLEQTGSVENCPEELQIIRSAIIRDNCDPEQWQDVVSRAWWPCHQQRMNFISSGIARGSKLKLPGRLCTLDLSHCCISDGALSDCLRGMASLEKLSLNCIMTITTLPPADVLQTLQSLRELEILHCWCLRSLGGLHALSYLQIFRVEGCRRLKMKNNDYALLRPTLQSVNIMDSI